MTVHADALLLAGLFTAGESADVALKPGRHAWVHVARGKVRVSGQDLGAGDAAAVSDEAVVRIEGVEDAEVLVFDLA